MIAVWHRSNASAYSPLIVALHGRGADEHDLRPVTDRLPRSFAAVCLRGLVDVDGGGYTWFENRGPARPIASSVRASVAALREWLDGVAPPAAGRPCYLLGFSAGMMMAGALLLDEPQRFAGAILLSGALAFDAGIPVEPQRLSRVPVLYARGLRDDVIPSDLVVRSERYLRERSGADLTAFEYDHGHTITSREIVDIAGWLDDRR